MKNLSALSLALLLVFAFSCRPNDEETATKGHLRVLVAESVAPVMVREVNNFMSLYKARGADVTYSTMQSKEANEHFLNDTARIIVTTIPLSTEEKERVKKTTDHLADIALAYDGVVAIVQKKNTREDLTLKQIQDILSGSVTAWEQLDRSRPPRGKVHLFLQESSDVSRFLSQRVLGGKTIKTMFRRTSNSLQTVQEVSTDPLALGFVGLSWIDSAGGNVKILSLAADSAFADTTYRPPAESIGNAYSPHPAHIYLNYYPFKRTIYVYARTSAGDFATGFVSYLASPPGQKTFLNAGMVPGTQQIVLKRPGQE